MSQTPTSTVPRAAFALLAFVFLAVLVTVPAAGQESQAGDNSRMQSEQAGGHNAPDVMVIYREEVKPGRTAVHEKLEANFARTYAKSTGTSNYLALTSISGAPEAWFIEPHHDFKDVEKSLAAYDTLQGPIKTQLEQLSGQESDNLSSMRMITALYRPDLSRPAAIDIPKMRFMQVTTYRVRPGHEAEFAEAAKLVRAAYEKGNVSAKWFVYQVYSGSPNGTYFVFEPIEKFAQAGPDPVMEKAFHEALGEGGGKQLAKLMSDGILSSEMNIFAFSPKMSYAPPEFAKADPFWAPAATAQMAQAGTSGATGTAGKTGTAKPAVPRASKDEKKK